MYSIPLAIARVSENRWVRWPVHGFTYLFRGTPLYIQLLICYSGIYSLAAVQSQPLLGAFFAMPSTAPCWPSPSIRAPTPRKSSPVRSVQSPGEVQAARAYGFNGWKLYRRVVMPQALRRALPVYSNEVILLLHSTTLAFTATVPDILKVARDANAATLQTFPSFVIAAGLYLIATFALVGLFRLAERRWLAFLGPRR